MEKLRARFPHVLVLAFEPEGAARRRPQLPREGRRRDDLTVATEFVAHVRNSPATAGERRLLAAALRRRPGPAPRGRRSRGTGLMRPHLLRVTAFGAFGGTAEVSFDELAGCGLFLLHGETGAGKTTLLDAIGFALYGRVPGERNKTKRLRSDHASAAGRTEVTFETTIGGRHLRITRRPQQVRPKVHGTGTTSEPAKILLEEESGGTLAHRLDAGQRGRRRDRRRHGHVRRAVLPGRAAAAGSVRAVPARRRGRAARAAAAAVPYRPVPHRRGLAGRTAQDDPGPASQEADQALATLAARIAQVAGVPGPGEAPVAQPARARCEPAAEPAAEPAESPLARPAHCPAPSPTLPGEDGAADPPPGADRRLGRRARRRRGVRPRRRRPGGRGGPETSSTPPAPPRTAPGSWRTGRAAAPPCWPAVIELQAGEPQRTAVRRELDAAGRAAEITKVLDDAERAMAQLATARDAEAGARAAAAAAGLPATAVAADFRAAEQDRRQRVGRLETLREVAGQAGAEDSLAAGARRRAADRATQIDAAGRTLAGLRVRQEERGRQPGRGLAGGRAAAARPRRGGSPARRRVRRRAARRRLRRRPGPARAA